MLTDYRLNPASMFLVFMANQTQGVNNIFSHRSLRGQ